MNNKFRDKKIPGLAVEVRNDDVTRALRTWSKKVQDSGLLKEIKDRMEYEPPTTKRKRLKKEARKRWEKTVEELIVLGHWHKDRAY
jgi:small subunit ribosomal protein S21